MDIWSDTSIPNSFQCHFPQYVSSLCIKDIQNNDLTFDLLSL